MLVHEGDLGVSGGTAWFENAVDALVSAGVYIAPPAPTINNAMLSESGDFILTESADYILLEG